ncbi:MAG: pseudaminic acid cytidylyltransferase [Sphingobacteriales bacterium]|nr:MAG: pseudaminic acid cytidylyltransferase [Sphingobacteriales bacterium]
MGNVAIIPARGGSKRIPRKNIRPFLGKPIIAYSIEAAINSGLFEEVMVSTDDHEIAEVAVKHGAKVPFFRSAENANDFSTTFDVIEEVISAYKNIGQNLDFGCCIYPTAPLIKINHLQQGFDLLKSKIFNTVFPVVAFGYPVWRGFEITENEQAKMFWPEHQNSRSQDLKKVYHDAGQWYWFNVEKILQEKQLYTQNSGSVIMQETDVQDIDNETDWKLAELKYKLRFE